jgi:hypothetical protein
VFCAARNTELSTYLRDDVGQDAISSAVLRSALQKAALQSQSKKKKAQSRECVVFYTAFFPTVLFSSRSPFCFPPSRPSLLAKHINSNPYHHHYYSQLRHLLIRCALSPSCSKRFLVCLFVCSRCFSGAAYHFFLPISTCLLTLVTLAALATSKHNARTQQSSCPPSFFFSSCTRYCFSFLLSFSSAPSCV